MSIIKSTGIILGLALLLGALTSAPNLQRTIAQNATGNATNVGHTEGLVVRGQSMAQPVSNISCMVPMKQVPSLGLTFTASNDSGKLNGWWNIPSSVGGNNVGGKISHVKVDKNMFELKGTMNYDYLCAQKNNLDYEISITGNCGGNGTIGFESRNEISSHNFTGSVIC